ncbi:MAG TPA: UDP-N-acetylmuramoyl-L-alanine--D-glutamate ligase [Elusimicrobia bacterium]|nr:UDP-N-acetylmuramoyl-L-alanine--D-glutamate ligase [Elusimicrobiota bacterium]
MFNPENFKGQKALVIGAGKSGIACARLLSARGFSVLLSEAKQTAEVRDKIKDLGAKAKVETGGHSRDVFNCGFAVKSPGMPRSNPLIFSLEKRKIPVFSEVEIALAFSKAKKILAITGTNGKTTTTVLLGEIIKKHLSGTGARSLVCGNVGIPASALAQKARADDCMVMELSSYQLEDSSYLKPSVSCVLNITPDHLDHHGGMAGYIRAKEKVFKFQTKDDSCVLNHEDPRCRALARLCKAKTLYFSSVRRGGGLKAYRESDNGLVFKMNGKTFRLAAPALPGAHNIENAMCAGLMALAAGVKPETLKQVFEGFKGVEHRIETARTLNGVTFINDSKATNVDSTLVALKALGGGKNIHLILGGLDKGCPYSPLKSLLRKYVKEVLTIGAAAAKIQKELSGACLFTSSENLETAVKTARANAAAGDMVLLSPACASFDQFLDYEDRGRKFKELVRGLR